MFLPSYKEKCHRNGQMSINDSLAQVEQQLSKALQREEFVGKKKENSPCPSHKANVLFAWYPSEVQNENLSGERQVPLCHHFLWINRTHSWNRRPSQLEWQNWCWNAPASEVNKPQNTHYYCQSGGQSPGQWVGCQMKLQAAKISKLLIAHNEGGNSCIAGKKKTLNKIKVNPDEGNCMHWNGCKCTVVQIPSHLIYLQLLKMAPTELMGIMMLTLRWKMRQEPLKNPFVPKITWKPEDFFLPVPLLGEINWRGSIYVRCQDQREIPALWWIQYCDGDRNDFRLPEGSEKSIIGFLFIHQTREQWKLLSCFGEMVLLDATYKTTKYALPLFMHANAGYIPEA